MTNAEKEAREIVRAILDAAVPGDERQGPQWRDGLSFGVDQGPFADRILRFAREHGPTLALRDAERLYETPGEHFSPLEDTTPPGWGRVEIPGLTPGAHPVPRFPLGTSQRGKPF